MKKLRRNRKNFMVKDIPKAVITEKMNKIEQMKLLN